jgi:kynurenine formamidase
VRRDFRDRPDGHVNSAAAVEAELARIEQSLATLDIVLVNTAAAAAHARPDHVPRGCGIGREATLWLTERGVRVTGTDTHWDAPFLHTGRRWLETRFPTIIGERHRAAMVTGYCHIEKLSDLEALPDHGFNVACFPVKLKGGSAVFTRAVALLQG